MMRSLASLLSLPPASASDEVLQAHLLRVRLAIAELEAAEAELDNRLGQRRAARIVERFRANVIEPLGRG